MYTYLPLCPFLGLCKNIKMYMDPPLRLVLGLCKNMKMYMGPPLELVLGLCKMNQDIVPSVFIEDRFFSEKDRTNSELGHIMIRWCASVCCGCVYVG